MSAVARQRAGSRAEPRPAPAAVKAPAAGDRVRARLHAYALDARLAGGERADGERLLAARAWQLTRRGARERLARALDAVLGELDGTRASRAGAAVPIDRCEAQIARSELIRLAERMRDGQPVAARGVARLRRLLCDGASPLYLPSPAGTDDELWRALRRAAIALG
jgi:hypothetical protein